METLADLQSRFAHPGRIEAIMVRPERNAPMQSLQHADLLEDGLAGDRSRAGKRAVTLIQAEHLPVIAALMGRDAVDPLLLRRNIVVSGINVAAFRGKRLSVGDAIIDLTVPCHPCSKMERILGLGGYTAMRGHGGMCASVLTPAQISVGAPVALAQS